MYQKQHEIFAACTFSDAHLLYTYDCTKEEKFREYVDDLTGVRDMNSHVRSDVDVSYGDFILTMSTCIRNQPTQRWLVTAVLLNDQKVEKYEGQRNEGKNSIRALADYSILSHGL